MAFNVRGWVWKKGHFGEVRFYVWCWVLLSSSKVEQICIEVIEFVDTLPLFSQSWSLFSTPGWAESLCQHHGQYTAFDLWQWSNLSDKVSGMLFVVKIFGCVCCRIFSLIVNFCSLLWWRCGFDEESAHVEFL